MEIILGKTPAISNGHHHKFTNTRLGHFSVGKPDTGRDNLFASLPFFLLAREELRNLGKSPQKFIVSDIHK